ncbi:hypothetical protein H696_01255 [Fonticula alba]|uniref:C2 NT-type domain-containing protein n=1 Tax=Fonticula alba TaxID=691883 RepID=A0A058ZEF5_FONAL|nr:hypothetical protein H696_01255 [Fonticula alba]KCV71837.1 hypothetical protein H696_01255 [Fonticula alba]|eukprot:XP_009493415.1 hypothetical protein H696_01255 [Fonticula alba]
MLKRMRSRVVKGGTPAGGEEEEGNTFNFEYKVVVHSADIVVADKNWVPEKLVVEWKRHQRIAATSGVSAPKLARSNLPHSIDMADEPLVMLVRLNKLDPAGETTVSRTASSPSGGAFQPKDYKFSLDDVRSVRGKGKKTLGSATLDLSPFASIDGSTTHEHTITLQSQSSKIKSGTIRVSISSQFIGRGNHDDYEPSIASAFSFRTVDARALDSSDEEDDDDDDGPSLADTPITIEQDIRSRFHPIAKPAYSGGVSTDSLPSSTPLDSSPGDLHSAGSSALGMSPEPASSNPFESDPGPASAAGRSGPPSGLTRAPAMAPGEEPSVAHMHAINTPSPGFEPLPADFSSSVPDQPKIRVSAPTTVPIGGAGSPELEAQIRELREQLSNVMRERDEVIEDSQLLEQQLSRLRERLAAESAQARSAIPELNKEIERLREKNGALQEEIARAAATPALSRSSDSLGNAQAAAAAASALSLVEQKSGEIEQLRQQLAEKNAEISRLMDATQERDSEIEQMSDELAEKTRALKAAQQKLQENERATRGLEKDVEDARRQADDLRRNFDQHKLRSKADQDTAQTALAAQLQAAQTARHDAERRAQALEEDLERSEREADEQLAQFEQRISKLRAKHHDEVNALQEELDRVTARMLHAEEQAASASSALGLADNQAAQAAARALAESENMESARSAAEAAATTAQQARADAEAAARATTEARTEVAILQRELREAVRARDQAIEDLEGERLAAQAARREAERARKSAEDHTATISSLRAELSQTHSSAELALKEATAAAQASAQQMVEDTQAYATELMGDLVMAKMSLAETEYARAQAELKNRSIARDLAKEKLKSIELGKRLTSLEVRASSRR